MKKIISLLTLALVAGVSCSTASAKGKKDKKQAEAPVVVKQPVVLQSAADSLSYAAGQSRTMGMMEYVQGQLGVDTAYTQAFVDALRESLASAQTPESKAKAAGQYIAFMVSSQMAPQLESQLKNFNSALNLDIFKRGFIDAVEKDASVLSTDESQKYFNTKMQDLQKAATEAKMAAGREWLEQNKTKEGVQTTPSGLQYKVIRMGNGPIATKDADVEVRYEGKLIDGTVFDSSYTRNPNTTSFKPSQVIKGWTEALCMMPEGSEWELYIPQDLGYGSRDTGKIPAYSTLIFKVEVVKVTPEAKAEEAPAAPAQKAPAKKPVAKKK